MDKDMANAPMPKLEESVGRLKGTGIKLKVTNKLGKSVNYGVQLNNTTLEIEALPKLRVEVVGFVGFMAMYEALKKIRAISPETIIYDIAGKALSEAEER